MARTRRQAAEAAAEAEAAEDAEDAGDEHEWMEKRRAGDEAGRRSNLVQTALAGIAGSYVTPDHQPGEKFPGRQPPTTQLSLFQSGIKRPFRRDEIACGWVPHPESTC